MGHERTPTLSVCALPMQKDGTPTEAWGKIPPASGYRSFFTLRTGYPSASLNRVYKFEVASFNNTRK
eukprot:1186504-Prorocentrum_minimum.AAC.1